MQVMIFHWLRNVCPNALIRWLCRTLVTHFFLVDVPDDMTYVRSRRHIGMSKRHTGFYTGSFRSSEDKHADLAGVSLEFDTGHYWVHVEHSERLTCTVYQTTNKSVQKVHMEVFIKAHTLYTVWKYWSFHPRQSLV